MDVKYLNPFIEGSQTVIRQIITENLEMEGTYFKNSPYKSDRIMVIVGVTGKSRGQVTFVMNQQTAVYLVSRMMGGACSGELTEISKSAIAELCNMIMGNTATILYNRGLAVEITPPSILIGDNMEVSTGKMETVSVLLKLENDYELSIDISFEKKENGE